MVISRPNLTRYIYLTTNSFEKKVTQFQRSKKIRKSVYPTGVFDFDSIDELKDPLLREGIDFWTKIYSKIPSYQGVIHDSVYVGIIYETLDFRGQTRKKQKELISRAKQKWQSVLYRVHEKVNHIGEMTQDELHVFKLFLKIKERNKYLEAARPKRIRFQLGQKDRFKNAIRESGRYLPMMEKIFSQWGVPTEITRLPFVESSFVSYARSKVGAQGIWQFMKSTGRLFLRIDEWMDQRRDPYFATEAAAQLLKSNFDSLGRWPLAIVAYNHGRKGMMRAVSQVGTQDLGQIIRHYRNVRFGFASRNFFLEFMAAYRVESQADLYFKDVKRKESDSFIYVTLPDFVAVSSLKKFFKFNNDSFEDANPSFGEEIVKSKKRIPAGVRIRLPKDWSDGRESPKKDFFKKYSAIPKNYKHRRQR